MLTTSKGGDFFFLNDITTKVKIKHITAHLPGQ